MFETTETIALPRGGKLHLRVWAVGPSEDDFIELLDSFVEKAKTAVQNDAPKLAQALTGRKLRTGITIGPEEMHVTFGANEIHCQLTAVVDRSAGEGTLLSMLEGLVVNDLASLAAQRLAEYSSAEDMRLWPSEEFDDPDAAEETKLEASPQAVVSRSRLVL